MGTATRQKVATSDTFDTTALTRILQEGYGPGAWHGPDMKAALSDVTPQLAFWRPAAGRHNIAEIALHHAYFTRSVRERLSGTAAEPFPVPGDEWFELSLDAPLAWKRVEEVVESQQRLLEKTVGELTAARVRRLPDDVIPLDLVLGITCHAAYHAGQIQLIKRLRNK
jgi:hypothetical protein